MELAAKVYDRMEPFAIENDRMAELLLPLQTVVALAELGAKAGIGGFPGHTPAGTLLKEYAEALDARDKEEETQTPGIRLLTAIREIFAEKKVNGKAIGGIPTKTLIDWLVERTEEPWGQLCRGEKITAEALAKLLRPYGIRSKKNKGTDMARVLRR